MFDKFGEFDSAEELNRAAAAQFKEGNEKAIYDIAKENGIDIEDAEDYMDGVIAELVSVRSAAIGKLKVEAEEYKLKGLLGEWVDELTALCMEDEAFAKAVRRKGKELAELIARFADHGYENSVEVDKRIVAKTNKVKGIVGNHKFAIGVPDKKTRRELAKAYYLG